MRFTLAAAAVSLLCACGAYDLSGDWMGTLTCGNSAELVMNTTLEPTDVDLRWEGEHRIQFTSSDDEEIDIGFTLQYTLIDPPRGAEELTPEVAVSDCSEASFGEINCWQAAATWDVVDDELEGTLTGFIVNDGSCVYTQER